MQEKATILFLLLLSTSSSAIFRTHYNYQVDEHSDNNVQDIIDHAFDFWTRHSIFTFDKGPDGITIHFTNSDRYMGFVNTSLDVYICDFENDYVVLYNLVVHELGHVLGLHNNEDETSVMYRYNNRVLEDFDSPLPLQDQITLDKLVESEMKNYFLESIDVLTKISDSTWIAIKGNDIYYQRQYVSHRPLSLPWVNALTRLANDTLVAFSGLKYIILSGSIDNGDGSGSCKSDNRNNPDNDKSNSDNDDKDNNENVNSNNINSDNIENLNSDNIDNLNNDNIDNDNNNNLNSDNIENVNQDNFNSEKNFNFTVLASYEDPFEIGKNITAAVDIGFDRMLLFTDDRCYLWWNNIPIKYMLTHTYLNEPLGAYITYDDDRFFAVVMRSGMECVYWRRNLELKGCKALNLGNFARYYLKLERNRCN